jgi:hypothetical protein
MVEIDLIQPRHNYAPSEGQGHVYLPTSLLTVGSRLLNSGVEVIFHDENITPAEISTNYIGFNLLGAPYIPEVIRRQEEIRKESGDKTFLVGGQVISGLNIDQLKRLFGSSTHNGNNDPTLSSVLGIDEKSLTAPERTSLIPAYKGLDDETMKEYLSREFSLYVSQGCKFACDFCAAARTYKDPVTRKLTKVTEAYRDPVIIQEDLVYLVKKAKSFRLGGLQIYMSNLDVFQTPSQLLRFANVVKGVRQDNPDFDISLHALATVDSYLRTRDASPRSIEALVEAGFNTVGFGVDGMTPEVWNAVKKGHNSEDKCLEAIRSAKEDFGITPEILMVFGYDGVDTERTLKLAYDFTLDMVTRFGAVPRPHVAKSFIPGNDGWKSQDHVPQVEALMQHPESFQSLDFTALPSPLTHPNDKLRKVATDYFLRICGIPGNTTLHVKPITPYMSSEQVEEVKKFNQGRYDR